MEFLRQKYRVKMTNRKGVVFVGSKTQTTKEVAKFYQVAPFPNYNDFQTKVDLLDIINSNSFLRDLKETIGFNKKFIEVGSGTSQLSIALAIGTNNEVVALDPTIESLALGVDFAKKNKISNVKFLNADLFENPIKTGYFDFVWCSGVLHHTENTEKAFKIISKWVKPNGTLVLGLYNKYGRLRTNFRQILYKIAGGKSFARKMISIIDPVLRKDISAAKREAWIRDQYEHPVERSHTMDEVLRWFDNEQIKYIGSIPSAVMDVDYKKIRDMNGEKGTFGSRLFSQIGMLFSNLGSEGGLFIVIGKKIKVE